MDLHLKCQLNQSNSVVGESKIFETNYAETTRYQYSGRGDKDLDSTPTDQIQNHKFKCTTVLNIKAKTVML